MVVPNRRLSPIEGVTLPQPHDDDDERKPLTPLPPPSFSHTRTRRHDAPRHPRPAEDGVHPGRDAPDPQAPPPGPEVHRAGDEGRVVQDPVDPAGLPRPARRPAPPDEPLAAGSGGAGEDAAGHHRLSQRGALEEEEEEEEGVGRAFFLGGDRGLSRAGHGRILSSAAASELPRRWRLCSPLVVPSATYFCGNAFS